MIQKITTIIPEHWAMDGGVSFGVVPKSLWNKLYPADDMNNLYIVNRLLLVETQNKKILINTGYGNKRNEKYYSYKFFKSRESLSDCLLKIGVSTDDITDVIYTHLHDDHCGGGTEFSNDGSQVVPVFKNANYHISQKQWEWALNPNPREAASYFTDNLLPLKEFGKLKLHSVEIQEFESDGILLKHFNGHTAGQMIPVMKMNGKTFVYVSDFIPSYVHLPLPYIAAVDISPLDTLAEKASFLKEAADNGYILVFEHDTQCEACTVGVTEKGFTADKIGRMNDFL